MLTVRVDSIEEQHLLYCRQPVNCSVHVVRSRVIQVVIPGREFVQCDDLID